MAAPETSPAAMRKTERRIVACNVEREGEKVEVSSDEEELCTVDDEDWPAVLVLSVV